MPKQHNSSAFSLFRYTFLLEAQLLFCYLQAQLFFCCKRNFFFVTSKSLCSYAVISNMIARFQSFCLYQISYPFKFCSKREKSFQHPEYTLQIQYNVHVRIHNIRPRYTEVFYYVTNGIQL